MLSLDMIVYTQRETTTKNHERLQLINKENVNYEKDKNLTLQDTPVYDSYGVTKQLSLHPGYLKYGG